MDQYVLELINQDIDGELDAAGRKELESVLEHSAKAREARSEMLRLSNLLDQAPQLSVPAGLRDSIIRQVKLPRETREPFLQRMFGAWKPLPVALSFGAGLLVAVVALKSPEAPGSAEMDINSMVGTMVSGESMADTHQRGRMSLNSNGLSGTITLHERGELYVLNFELDSDEPVEVAIGLTEAGLSFGGVARSGSTNQSHTESIEVSGGTLRVRNQGRQTVTVFLNPLDNTEVKGNNLSIDILPGSILGGSEKLQG